MHMFGINDAIKKLEIDKGRKAHEMAREVLILIANTRGYKSGGRGGVPDVEHTSRMIIKAFVDGKQVVRCVKPPGADSELWDQEEQRQWERRVKK